MEGRPDRPIPPAPVPLERTPPPLTLFRMMRRNPIETLTRAHYEDLTVTTRSFLGTVVATSSPAAVRHVMIANAANYRRHPLQSRILSDGLGFGLLGADGDQWRSQRSVIAPFFSPRAVAGFEDVMIATSAGMVDEWRRQPDGSRINLFDEISAASVQMVSDALFPDGIGDAATAFPDAFTHYVEKAGRIGVADPLPFLSWLPRPGHLRARPQIRAFERIADTIVAAHDQGEAAGSRASGIVGHMRSGATEKRRNELDEQEVRANIKTFLAAGYETSATTLSLALYLLWLDPPWRERIEAEADREVGGAAPSAGLAARLVETRAVIEETLRLYPSGPFIARQALGPDEVDGERFGPRATVVISPWVIHRHKRLWQASECFDPSRFLPGRRESIDRFSYLPFGMGARVCVGHQFAMQSLTIHLAMIVRAFRLEPASGFRVWPSHILTLRPGGPMPMTLHRR